MGSRPMFEVPDGWVARGFVFEVETTSPEQPGQVAQAFGARRYTYNWALGQVRANLDARAADPTVPPLAWNFYELRKAWNQAKYEVAPWWRCTSKEAYASGIADLVTGLHNWSDAKAGRRKGARVGFPRFKARHRDRGRVRFTTGAMRLEPDRRHLTLPVIGKLRSKENTRRLERLVVNGWARILSMTLSQRGGGWSWRCRRSSPCSPASRPSRTGAAASTLASASSGRSSPTMTAPSNGWRILPPGRRSISSSAAWPGKSPVAPSGPELTGTRKPSVRRWIGGR
jgi:hypothetical protein